MEFLPNLWLPILLSGVFVFIMSSIIHMATPLHKGDFKKMPGEDSVMDALRKQSPERGTYMIPCPASMKDAGTPEMVEKYNKGPVGFLTIVPSGPPSMGKSLIQWFVYTLIVGILVAYTGWHALGSGAEYLTVFRVTGTAALLGYGIGTIAESIWKGQTWGVTFKSIFDGIVYALVTAGAFGWLWPSGM